MFPAVRSTLLICLLVMAACSDSDRPSSSNTVDDYVNAWRANYCAFKIRCGMFPDVATCQAQDRTLAVDPDVLAAVHAGFVEFHPEVAEQCLTALAQRTCDSTMMADRLWDLPCYGTFVGTRHDGEACALDGECASGECTFSSPLCIYGELCCSGTCKGDAAPPIAMINQSCRAAPCGEGLCNRSRFICDGLKDIGSLCEVDAECAYGSACFDGECTATVGSGEACSQQTSPLCKVTGETCHTASGVCEPGQPVGGACTDAWDCAAGTCAEGHCVDLRAKAGEPCGAYGCQSPAYCDGERLPYMCVAPKADGELCRSDDECASQWCDFGTGTCSSEPCI